MGKKYVKKTFRPTPFTYLITMIRKNAFVRGLQTAEKGEIEFAIENGKMEVGHFFYHIRVVGGLIFA